MKNVLVLICILPLSLFAAGTWQTFTNTSEIREFAIVESTLWAATNGGILRVDTETHEYEKYTNTEGLEQIDVVTMAYDPNNFVWAAMPDGLLQILNVETGEWDIYNEFQNEVNVHVITPHEDFVLVGFENGVAELKLDAKQRWERTWKADIGNVNAILITDDFIWVGQDNGVRRISIDHNNKQIPGAWEFYSVAEGMLGENVHALHEFEGDVLVGTSSGVSYFDGWTLYKRDLLGSDIRSICTWDGQLTVATDTGVRVKDPNENFWWPLATDLSNCAVVRETSKNDLWLGTTDDGLHWWQNGAWEAMPFNGPKSNSFSDMLIDRDGHLWVTSSQRPAGGVYHFDGEKWTNFTRPDGLATFDYRSIEEDVYGRIWAGSYGAGVTLFTKEEDGSITFQNLYDMDGNLSYAGSSVGYVVVIDMIADDQNNMWFLTLDAGNKQVLQVYDLDNSWQYWSTVDGIRNVKTSCITIDNVGRKWIGTGAPSGVGGSGVSVLDDNGTPFDKSDDDLTGYLDESEGLEDNNITALAEDLDGTMWIGTVGGLNYWFGNVGARYNTINDNIQALYVDPRNNKWIGTIGGLSVLDSDNFSWTHYTTSNSMLVSDLVTSFAFNEETGEIYIGTANGLSRFETPFTKPAANLSSVSGFPNPFRPDEENARFYIDNLAEKSNVSIFTADGHLVKTIPPSEILGARVSWDGTNNEGDKVAAGIYVYLVTAKAGEAGGKIAVVR
jgi:ligand-binding sensor domain-containing protein